MTRGLRVDPAALLHDVAVSGAIDASIRDRCRRLVLPLERADAERGSDLRATLRAYFANGCSVAKTAETLFLHRNSVRYRLDRIRSLLRLDVEHHEIAATLLLAMTIAEMERLSFDDRKANEAQRPQ